MQVYYQVEECRRDPAYDSPCCSHVPLVISGEPGQPGKDAVQPAVSLYSSPLAPSGFPYQIPVYNPAGLLVVTFETTLATGGWSMTGSSPTSLNIATAGVYEITTVCQVENRREETAAIVSTFATFNTGIIRESISTSTVGVAGDDNRDNDDSNKSVRQIFSSFRVQFRTPGTLIFHAARADRNNDRNGGGPSITSSAEQAVGTEPYWYTVTVAKASD